MGQKSNVILLVSVITLSIVLAGCVDSGQDITPVSRLTYISTTEEDTDGDGLTDYEEVYDYGTDPNEEDTDGDGFNVVIWALS